MKKLIFLVLIVCVTLLGCNDNEKGKMDFKGIITGIDGNRILVEDEEKGPIWVTLPEDQKIDVFEKGQNVAVWTDGNIKESFPMQAEALHLEILKEETSAN